MGRATVVFEKRPRSNAPPARPCAFRLDYCQRLPRGIYPNSVSSSVPPHQPPAFSCASSSPLCLSERMTQLTSCLAKTDSITTGGRGCHGGWQAHHECQPLILFQGGRKSLCPTGGPVNDSGLPRPLGYGRPRGLRSAAAAFVSPESWWHGGVGRMRTRRMGEEGI